jgi:hypothetical protein
VLDDVTLEPATEEETVVTTEEAVAEVEVAPPLL